MQEIMQADPTRACARAACLFAVFLLTCLLSGILSSQADTTSAVTVVDVSTPAASEIALEDVRDVVRRLRRAALDIIDEVEQRDMVVVGEPLLVQPIPEKKDPHPGTMEEMFVLGKAQPPRKKWVDITMAEFDKLMALLPQEQAKIEIPRESQSEGSAAMQELSSITADMQQHYENLQKLTAGPTYRNVEIGKEALAIYDDTAKLEKPWRELVGIVRKKS